MLGDVYLLYTNYIGSTNSYKFEVNITDITANTPTQTLLFSTKYFAPMAFVTLEHNPAGDISNCNQLPNTATLDFINNKLLPSTMDMWQGAQNYLTCGLNVDTFPMNGNNKLSIHY